MNYYLGAWAGRQGVKLQERVMASPSRRGFALLFALESLLAALFAVGFMIMGSWWAVAVVIVSIIAGWATTRFLAEVPRWVRGSVVISAILGMLAVGILAQPFVAVGIAALFAYATGWYLTFLIAPTRAMRWREVTRGRPSQ